MPKGNKIARRNLRYDRLTMPRGVPEKPDWLDTSAYDHFDAICKRVDETGLLTTVDGDMIAVMATACRRVEECEDMKVERGLLADICKYAQQLGLTPYSRRLLPDATQQPEEKDALAKFLKVG